MVDESSSSLTLSRKVGEFVRKEVADWDDEVMATARFKAFSGQRSDWEPKYAFWRDLILRVATHLRVFLFHPSEVKNVWFSRGGLSPLCLDHVLNEMYNAGDILRRGDLIDPTSARLSQVFRRVVHLVGLSRSVTQVDIVEDYLILMPLLKVKAAEVVKVISENHWTSACIITMRKFQDICGGSIEASAILSYLSGCRKMQYITTNKRQFMEGVKVSLSPKALSGITSLDYDVLHLISTAEKLQQQLDMINQHWDKSRELALASLKSGSKKAALKHARELKLFSASRERCSSLLNRVEEVLRVISDAESSKRVSEAIQIGARAIKENRISVEEVQLCLQELEESIDLQKQVENVIESTPLYSEIEDEDVEDEFKNLQLEVENDSSQVCISKVEMNSAGGESEEQKTAADSLGDALSNLSLVDGTSVDSVTLGSMDRTRNSLKDLQLESI
ncbi:Charged multivesicular body protein [Actinidia chinensis var. chinensis]|uniref:Charged multivesicular body protein n=1 Tax=Actinidia chinensis var. chinensis TaxID=1590841 RepID=A0A2R6QDP2_ACTCC|nr:Charged multivesicular body protein [Actinidia chinensis var. chinensis]